MSVFFQLKHKIAIFTGQKCLNISSYTYSTYLPKIYKYLKKIMLNILGLLYLEPYYLT